MAIASAAVAVYANSFSGVFALDDEMWIIQNPTIKTLSGILTVLDSSCDPAYGGRPMLTISLALSYALNGMFGLRGTDVWGFHLVNLTIHILAAWTLFGIVRRTLLLPSPRGFAPLSSAGEGPGATGSQFAAAATPLALAIALLWTVHPLQTAAVTYIVQRNEALLGLFYLLTLYCVIRGATSPQAARAWYVGAVLSCLLGMGTKEVMVAAPLVVLLYDRTFLSGSFRAALARRRGLYAGLAATWGVVIWLLEATHFRGNTAGFGTEGFTALTYLQTQAGVLVHYLRLAIWPAGQCLDYGWRPAHGLTQVVLPGLLILTLLGLTVWALVKRPALGFLGATFFLILAPTSSFVPIRDAAFEHRMYLPLAALVTLAVLGVFWICGRLFSTIGEEERPNSADVAGPRVAVPFALGAIALVALGWVTVLRNKAYQSETAIWQDTVDKAPNNSRAQSNLGNAIRKESKEPRTIERALVHLQKAVDLDPNSSDAHGNLAAALYEQGKTEQAIAEYQRDLEIFPQDAIARSHLATIYEKLNRSDEALRNISKY